MTLCGAPADRGLTCTGCMEKVDLLQKLVPALRLPLRLNTSGVSMAIEPDSSSRRLIMQRQAGEDGASFLHRVLTSIVNAFSLPVLEEIDAGCATPSKLGCLSFVPAWDAITAGLRQKQV